MKTCATVVEAASWLAKSGLLGGASPDELVSAVEKVRGG
jgi:hypothetical protein